MEKVGNMQEQMGTSSRKMETLTKNKKNNNKEGRNTVTQMKNNFDGLISRLNTAEEKSVHLKICQQKFLELQTEKKISEEMDNSRIKESFKEISDIPKK